MIEDNEVGGSPREETEELDDDDDDSGDEDWGKNAVLEDAGDDDEEADMELEEENDVLESAKRKSSGKVEPKKRKLGEALKLAPMKKSKSGNEFNSVAVKHSPLEPVKILEGELPSYNICLFKPCLIYCDII